MPTVTSAPGLVTAVNEAEAPEGSLLEANNCVIRNKDVIEPRRGFGAYDYTFGGSTARAKQAFVYQDKLHVQHSASGSLLSGTLAYDTGSNFVDYSGSYVGPDEPLLRMKSVAFRNNLYFTTNNGIYKISNAGNPIQTAGVQQAFSHVSRTTGDINPIGNGVVSRTSNVVSVTYGLNPVSLIPPTVLGTAEPVGFVVGETVLCTSTDANFPSGSKIVTTSNLNAGTGGGSYNRGIFTYAEVGANANNNSLSGASIVYQSQTLLDASGFLADGNQCAYRFVLDLPDNNQQILLGPPSDKYEVANINGTVGWVTTQSKNVQLKIRLPSGLPTNARLWVYRTEQVPITIPTGEEFYKIYEYAITSYDLSTRIVVIKDIVIDSWLTEPLYTSPSQETALSANFIPQWSKDVASWSNRIWYANTKSNYSKTFRIIGELPNGTVFAWGVGNTLEYVAGTTTANNLLLTTDFFIPTTGSTSQRLETTARNVVEAINRNSSLVNAFYDEDESSGIGFVRLESKTNSYFTIGCIPTTTNIRTSLDPILPLYPQLTSGVAPNRNAVLTRNASGVVTGEVFGTPHSFVVGDSITIQSGTPNFGVGPFTITTVTPFTFTYNEAGIATTTGGTRVVTYSGPYTAGAAEQEAIVNRLFYSKQQQGEAVPLLNYLDVGAPGKQILRIIPLRERLYVFKEDGIFTVAGEYPFRVDLLDDTAKLLAPDTCAIVGNQIFCLTSQGVVSVGESGVAIVSRSWENELLNQIQDINYIDSLTGSKGISYSWGCGYESERSYFLQIGQFGNDRVYVYNYLNRVWTRWVRSQRWGLVHPKTDRLLFGAQSNNFVFQERKTASYNSIDYCDLKITGTLGSADDTNYPISGSLAIGGPAVEVGDIVYCGISSDPSGSFYSNENVGVVTSIVAGIVYFDYLIYDEGFAAYVGQPIQIYKKYPVTLKWNALNLGAPAVVKQFDEWSPIFNVRTFRNATVEFSSDAQDTPTFNVTNTVVGSPFFNDGRTNQLLSTSRINPISKRVAVPRNQQRCTNLIVTLTINEAMAYWRLLGFNYEAKPISPLANRKK